MTDWSSAMDQLPFDFSERVAALWKCCDLGYDNCHLVECLDTRVPDCKWTRKSKKQRITLHIGKDRSGKWKYFFSKSLSLNELEKNPKLKNVAIQEIKFRNDSRISMYRCLDSVISTAISSRADIERLFKMIVFHSNEPRLGLDAWNAHDLVSPECATVLNCLSRMTFSSIWASYDFPVYNPILENQFSRRRPTRITVGRLAKSKDFFFQHLGSGNIKRSSFSLGSFTFPSAVLKRIINGFMENPENYDHFDIFAKFENSTKILNRKLRKGRCVKVVDSQYAKEYCFQVTNPKLKKNPCMRIRKSAFGTIIVVN